MTALRPDLAIIGSGSGNTVITPFWDDKRVVLAEQNSRFGGTCLNVGCIPTKMFVRAAMVARSPEEAARLGVTQHTDAVDWPAIRDRIFGRTDAASDAGKRYREVELENVDLISQRVRLTGLKSFVAGDGTRVDAEQLVIAAGSRPVLPDAPGIDLPQVHTSDTVMRLDELPRRIVILGGGYVACEFAAIFSGLGSEVVQLNRGPYLMKTFDAEIREVYTTEARKHWRVRTGRLLRGISENAGGGVTVEVAVVRGPASPTAEGRGPGGAAIVPDESPREVERYDADVVLVAMGRRPNSDLVDAAAAGIDLHEDGRIAVDEFQRVLAGGAAVDGLYALGDVSSVNQLKHVANHEARVVAHNLEHPADLRSSGDMPVPAAVFTHPELARVGMTETEAIEEIGTENVTTKTQEYGDTAYGWAMEDRTGIFKVVADRRDGRILGAHVMGYEASILIQVVTMAMSFGIDAYTAARGQYWPHPALMEVVENALLGLEVPEDGRLSR